MMEKSPHYYLIIDRQRNKILATFYRMTMQNPINQMIFEAALQKKGVTHEEIVSFLEDWIDKEHEMKWCEDTNCESNKKTT